MSRIILILPLLLFIDVAWGLTDTVAVSPGQFPSYASIVLKLPAVKEQPVCGGVIINDRYILTSGQCDCISLRPTVGLLRVKVGLQYRHDDGDFVQTLDVEKVIINKQLKYGLFVQIKEYDIGLIKVTKPIVFNERVQAVTLPAPNYISTGRATVVGLGSIDGNILIPRYPNQVQQIEVELIDKQECSRTIRGYSFLNNKELNRQLCSKPVNKKATACKGDSGDPLIQNQEGEQVVIGILTWAPFPCRQKEAPIVYTSVSQYIQWIREKIQSN